MGTVKCIGILTSGGDGSGNERSHTCRDTSVFTTDFQLKVYIEVTKVW